MDSHLPQLERVEASDTSTLRSVAPNIWATRDEVLGGPANTCGFLVQRPTGNAFIYSCSSIDEYFDHIDRLGGVKVILLNHRDEATKHVTTLAERYNAPVRMHRAEVQAATERGVRHIVALATGESLGDDLVVVPTPGHTPGTTSYVYTNPDSQTAYIFTGDTFTNFTVDRFETVLGFHSYDGNLTDMHQTLVRLSETPTDVILPGLANGTIHAYTWDQAARQRLLDHAGAQLPSN